MRGGGEGAIGVVVVRSYGCSEVMIVFEVEDEGWWWVSRCGSV